MKREETNRASDWLDCPFCGCKPDVTKHHTEDIWSLVHRCQALATISIEWTELSEIRRRWNTRAPRKATT